MIDNQSKLSLVSANDTRDNGANFWLIRGRERSFQPGSLFSIQISALVAVKPGAVACLLFSLHTVHSMM